ncbi:MAG: GPP34 family phosphoprotein [Capsulimonadales bacterium]|nr:GPP34 family phosphoprotein [Capsulimonadales bacterium]
MISRLSLAERILLLTLNERSGQIDGAYTPLLLAAANVAELAAQGRVRVDETTVFLLDSQPTEDPAANLILAGFGKRRTVTNVLSLLPHGRDRKRWESLLTSGLVVRGVWASETERRFFSERTVYATIDPEYANGVRADLQKTLESRQSIPEPSAVLIALLNATRRTDLFLTPKESRFFADRIGAIVSGSPLAFALSRQIEAVIASDDAAATAAVTAAISG